MVEVDPRLFVTCRLCLEVEGQFQIIPSVQQQIKYCFDIDVQPFDRLPQLICKKCENILREYYAIKKNFIEKQEELKAKLQNNVPQPEPTHFEESDSSTADNEVKTKRKHKSKKVKKRRTINRLMSSSCDDLDNESTTSTSQLKVNYSTINWDIKQWEENFCKYFVCRICSKKFMHIEDMKMHINEHKPLQMKYKNIFNISCLVVMEKFDDKPNITHSNKSVVYSSECILQNKHNPYYYAVYNPIKTEQMPADDSAIKSEESDSTDSEILSSKRRRMISRSSSETVVINRHCQPANESPHVDPKSNTAPTVIDCIDIDDSSDEKSNDETKSINKDDSKTMDSIIMNCYNRYAKRIDSVGRRKLQDNKNQDCLLQRKVLSIGKKVINSRGFKCTGILRFLECKDLSVIWNEANIFTDGKYVQIATRTRGNDSGENVCYGKNINDFVPTKDNCKKHRILSKVKKIKDLNSNLINTNHTEDTQQNVEEKDLNSIDHLPRISSVFSHVDLEISNNPEPDSQQKLLNPNPVLNPKQLPKKTNESSSLKISKVYSAAHSAHNAISYFDANLLETGNSNSMPVVTSTVSLTPAPESNMEVKNAATEASENSSSNSKPLPRIKVKPVSELMPEKPQNNIMQHNSRDAQSAPANIDNRSVIMWPNQNSLLSQKKCHDSTITAPETTNIKDVSNEYIVLDTVKFPNTRTHSPFVYLQNLLHVHNLTLLDTDAPVPPGAVCLIKLRLMCQQEKVQPVTLALSLFCCKNVFSIKVMDMQQRDVNINKLSANWQWQLLKIYNVQVAHKVLTSAAKINEETYLNTRSFFTLLHSIKNVQDNHTDTVCK